MPHDLALQADFRDGLFSGVAPEDVTATDQVEIATRYSVYRNNVMVSLIEALRQRFPVVERLIGETFARAMFAEFARTHPPRSPLMMRYGAELPAFLGTFRPAQSLAYLADVARLEMARGEAYHAADAQPVSQERLAQAAQADPTELRLRLHPSVRVLRSPHPVYTIWASNQPGVSPVRVVASDGEAVLVARRNLTVVTVMVSPGAAAFIQSLRSGDSFAVAAEAGLDAAPAFDPSPELARLISSQFVVGVD